MANQTLGFGTTLSWNGAIVAGLTRVGAPEIKTEMIDVTTHQSANAFKEFIAGTRDGGEVAIEGFFDYQDSPGQLALTADASTGVVRAGIITFPAGVGTQWAFNGIVETVKPADGPYDGPIPFTATIKVTGAPAFTVAVSAGLTTPFFSINNSAVVTPAASGSVVDYVATVLTGITSVVITPTAAAGVITITANGASQTVTSGQASSAIPLGAAGSITTVVISVKEGNKAAKTYTIRVDRP